MTLSDRPPTFFADPARVTREALEQQRRLIASNALVKALLDGFPEPAAVLNGQRQIVLANDKLAALTSAEPATLVGRRFGEAMGCEYASEPPSGCGTTEACRLCGAAQAIEHTRAAREPAREACRITLAPERGREALELDAWTTPVRVEGDPFVLFAVRDTSAEQRRRLLERLFFHDLLNSAGGLAGLLQVIPMARPDEAAGLTAMASRLAAQVVEEIQAQRDLAAAERGELEAHPEEVDVRGLLVELVALYEHHSVAGGKSIALDVAASAPPTLAVDPLLLRRVLGNLVKNALEASAPGDVVSVGYGRESRPVFTVHNRAAMPEPVRLQVFRRSFSTKAATGRGIGTYSARLLSERYLGGRLTFTSAEGTGTTFVVDLPARGGELPRRGPTR